MALEPIKQWDHLYCAVKQCGYPVSPYPPEAMQGHCMACGNLYSYEAVVAEEEADAAVATRELLNAQDDALKTGLPISLVDPSVRSGVEWLQNIAGGGMWVLCFVFSKSGV